MSDQGPKTEQEWFDYYYYEANNGRYTRAQAKNMANRRYMTQVINDLKQNEPELYSQLQTKVKTMELEEERKRREQDEFQRRQNELRKFARSRLERALINTGVPLPSFNLAPMEMDIDEDLMPGEIGSDQVLVSFRQWNIQSDGYLHGIGMGSGYAWKEVNFADREPTQRNDHGLYSVRLDPQGLITNAGHYFGEYCGLLELRGTIVEHDDGVLRAEWARILCIWVSRCEPDVYSHIPTLMEHYPLTPVFACTRKQVADALFRVTALQEMGRL